MFMLVTGPRQALQRISDTNIYSMMRSGT